MNRFVRAAMVAAILRPADSGPSGACPPTASSSCGPGRLWRRCRTVAATVPATATASIVGWPDRYNYAARQAVVCPVRPAGAQRPLPQPDHLELVLRAGQRQAERRPGWRSSTRIARATPGPDPRIYLQAARDLGSRRATTWTRSAIRRDDLTREAGRGGSAVHGDAAAVNPWRTRCSSTTLRSPVIYADFVGNAVPRPDPGYAAASAARQRERRPASAAAWRPADPASGSATIVRPGGGSAAGGSATGGGRGRQRPGLAVRAVSHRHHSERVNDRDDRNRVVVVQHRPAARFRSIVVPVPQRRLPASDTR